MSAPAGGGECLGTANSKRAGQVIELGKQVAPSVVVPSIDSTLSCIYALASGDTTWSEVALACATVLENRPVVLFVLEAQTGRSTLLGTSSVKLKEIPDMYLEVARRAGRRLKARVPSRLVGGRLPR